MRDPVQIGAVTLAIGLMVLWIFVSRPGPAPPPTPGAPGPVAESTEAPSAFPDAVPDVPQPSAAQGELATRPDDAGLRDDAAPARELELANDAVRVRVSARGGRVMSVRLLRYDDRPGKGAEPVELVTLPQQGTLHASLGAGILEGFERLVYRVEDSTPQRVTLSAARQGVEVRRELVLDPEGYGGELVLRLRNQGGTVVEPLFQVALLGRARPDDAPDAFMNYQLVAYREGDLEQLAVRGITSPGFFGSLFGGSATPEGERLPVPVRWAGIESQYFLMAAIPEDAERSSAALEPVARDTGRTRLLYPPAQLPPGHQLERRYRLYFGPKLGAAVEAVDPQLEAAVHVGWQWVRPLVTGFEKLLVWSYENVVANYGVGIILLTILLRLATYPLTQKSMKSMKRFGEMAPLMKEVQEKYGDDRERLSQEMMKLYREKGVNPFSAMGGGCIPMLIQMPFMIALYFALQGSIELRHAPFALWIQDLSAPENFFSIAGLPIRPLPLLMGASMLLQQRLSPQTGDPQQRQMMMWMSVLFTFMFYQFPSGLLLYWFVSNLLGIGQQLLVNRNMDAPVGAKKKKKA